LQRQPSPRLSAFAVGPARAAACDANANANSDSHHFLLLLVPQIIATIGPSCQSVDTLVKMLEVRATAVGAAATAHLGSPATQPRPMLTQILEIPYVWQHILWRNSSILRADASMTPA
jgi:hypothetical protein